MTKIVNCECGQTVRAEDENELVARVEAHVESDHPEMVGKLSREDIMADMAQYRAISKEHAEVTQIAGRYARYQQCEADLAGAQVGGGAVVDVVEVGRLLTLNGLEGRLGLLDGHAAAFTPVGPDTDPSALTALRVDEPIDDEIALVVATSGTTGVPKGALLTCAALAASADFPTLADNPSFHVNFLYLSTFTRSSGLLLGAALAFLWRPWKITGRPQTGAGAVLGEDGRIRFPRALVEDMLAKAARDLTLFGRDPRHDLLLSGTRVHFGTAGAAVHVVDVATQNYRESTVQDLHDAARIVQALDNVHFFQRAMVCRDIPDNYEMDVNTLYACCAGTTKHVGTSFSDPSHVAGCFELLHMIAGGEAAWRERPFVSNSNCFVVPPMKLPAEFWINTPWRLGAATQPAGVSPSKCRIRWLYSTFSGSPAPSGRCTPAAARPPLRKKLLPPA